MELIVSNIYSMWTGLHLHSSLAQLTWPRLPTHFAQLSSPYNDSLDLIPLSMLSLVAFLLYPCEC